MSALPLYAFVAGDTMGIVVLGRPDRTVTDLGEAMLRATSIRVGARGAYRITHDGRVLEPGAMLGTQGLRPLDRVDLVWEEG